MKKLLKFLLYIVIIAFVGVIIYAFSIYEHDTESTSSNNVVTNSVAKNNETKMNNTVEEKVEEKVEETNKKEENEVENETKEEVVSEEVSISSEEKALELAKKEYGTDDGVYFNCEQTESNNVYIVSVRDSETTKALAWYTVDVKNGTVK